MNDEDFPANVVQQSLEPLDDRDQSTLDRVRAAYDEADPMPDGLVDRVQFSLALDEMFSEVASLTRMPLDALAVRSDAATGTRTDTVTFSAERLTAMITVSRGSDGSVRIDGWIAPPSELEVRLRMRDGRRTVRSDHSGRFAFDDLPEGFVQLSFHPLDGPGTDAPESDEGVIVTPLFEL